MAVELALSLPVLTLNVAVVPFAGTATEAGAVRAALLLVKATLAPPAGAAVVRVTVQRLVALDPMVVGLQDTEETAEEGAAGTRVTVAFAEVAL